MSEEALMADMGKAWAHLAAYYYRDKQLQSSTRHVKKKNKLRERLLANRNRALETDSEEETGNPSERDLESFR